MNNFFSGAWGAVSAWMARTANKVKALAVAILAALGLTFVIVAAADDVSLSWNNATHWTDGSTLDAGDLAATELWRESFPLGADLSTETREYEQIASVDPSITSYLDADLADGIHCYVAYHVATNGRRSDASNESCKTVDTRRPNAPDGLSAS